MKVLIDRANRRNVVGLITIGMAILVCSPLFCSAAVLVPYGDCGWRYLQPNATFDPAGMSSPSYSDADWTAGCAPFRKPWGCPGEGTSVPLDGHVVARRHIDNPTGTDVTALCTVQSLGFAALYCNGSDVTSNCCIDACGYQYPIHAWILLHPGDNAIVVRSVMSQSFAADGGTKFIGGYLDVQVTGDGATETRGSSWGSLKLFYR